jgi:hypothetical protein
MRGRGQAFLVVLLLLMVMACGGASTSTTTTTEPPTETTGTPEDPGSVSSLDDLPAQCVDALRTYLQAIEPVVHDFDFQSASMEDFEVLSEEIATVTEGFEEETATCPELDQTADDGLALIKEFAAQEAPGTVAYFDFLAEFMAAFEGGGTASGDCETDIAAFQEFVDQGSSMSDLTASEVATASNLMSSIAVACSEERFIEWSEEVDAWING